MLTVNKSAGVAPEVKPRKPLREGNKACQLGIQLALKPRADVSRSTKQEYKWNHEKDFCPPKHCYQNLWAEAESCQKHVTK